jgi:hypothetical protein
VLHRATGSQQELGFEAEEAAILDATQRLPLRLDQPVHHLRLDHTIDEGPQLHRERSIPIAPSLPRYPT